MLSWAIRPFVAHSLVESIVVVLPASDAAEPPEWLMQLPVDIVAGGATRSESVANGLSGLKESDADVVLIHDGARPLVSSDLISRVLQACDDCGVIPGLPLTDTVKEVDGDEAVIATVDRDRLRNIQTPQAFPLAALREVYRLASAEGVAATDDAALFERYNRPVRVVPGEPANIKVTVPLDFDLAELLASRLLPGTGAGTSGEGTTNPIV